MKKPIYLFVLLFAFAACTGSEPMLVFEHDILEIYPNIERKTFVGSEPTISLDSRGIYYDIGDNKAFSGKLSGRWYDKSTAEINKVEYFVENGLLTEMNVYFNDGQIRHNQNAKTRWVTYWYNDGSIASERHIDKDIARGFYANGNMSFEYTENMKRVFYPDGKVKEVSERLVLPDGSIVLDGKHTSYYENGNLMAEGLYTNGNIDGEWVSYEEDGSIRSREKYNSGRKVES